MLPGRPLFIQNRKDAKINILSDFEGVGSRNLTLLYSYTNLSGTKVEKEVSVSLNCGGKSAQGAAIEIDKNGIYKDFCASLIDESGAEIAKIENARLTAIDYYEKQPFDEQSVLGINTSESYLGSISKSAESSRLNAKLLKNLGLFKVRRIYRGYDALETTIGLTDFELGDYTVNEHFAEGVRSIAGGATAIDERVPTNKEKMDNYLNFQRKNVSRYADKALLFEVWNEPNLKEFKLANYDDNAITYSNIAKHFYLTAKNASPGVTVLSGCVAGLGTSADVFLNNMFGKNVRAYSDGYSFHPYDANLEPDARFESTMYGYELPGRNAGGWLDLYATEFGYANKPTEEYLNEYDTYNKGATHNMCETLGEFANRTLKAYVITMRHRVKLSQTYCLYDNTGMRGFITDGGVVKDSFLMLSPMTRMLNGADYVGKLTDDSSKAIIHVFNRCGKSVMVAWGKSGADASYTFGETVKVTDKYGNSLGNAKTVSFSEPVYIEAESSGYITDAAKKELKSYCDYYGLGYSFSAAQGEALVDEIYSKGSDLISAFDKRRDIKELSIALYDLNYLATRAAQTYQVSRDESAYSVSSPAESEYAGITSAYKAAEPFAAKEYTEKILKKAAEYKQTALSALTYSGETAFANNRAAAYDKMSKGLCTWAAALAEKESADTNLGVLVYADESRIDNCVLGESYSAKLNVENMSSHSVSGKLTVCDQDGNVLNGSGSAVAAEAGGYAFAETTVALPESLTLDSGSAVLTVYLTSGGETVAKGYIQVKTASE